MNIVVKLNEESPKSRAAVTSAIILGPGLPGLHNREQEYKLYISAGRGTVIGNELYGSTIVVDYKVVSPGASAKWVRGNNWEKYFRPQ